MKNAVPLPDAYKRCPQCQMTSSRHETNVHAERQRAATSVAD